MFGMSPTPPPLWFGVYFLRRTALLLKEDLISENVPQVGEGLLKMQNGINDFVLTVTYEVFVFRSKFVSTG